MDPEKNVHSRGLYAEQIGGVVNNPGDCETKRNPGVMRPFIRFFSYPIR